MKKPFLLFGLLLSLTSFLNAFSQLDNTHGIHSLTASIPFKNVTLSNSASSVLLPIREINYLWNSIASSWIFKDTTYYSYSDSGKILIKLRVDASGNYIVRDTNTYDSSGNPSENIIQNWNAGAWENVSRTVTVFDSHKNKTENRVESWTGSAWDVAFGDKYIFSYSGSLLISKVHQTWTTGSWLNNDKIISQYNGSSQMTQELFQVWNGSFFEDNYKTDYFYSSGQVSSETSQSWNGTTWLNDVNYYSVIWNTWNSNIYDSEIKQYTQQYWSGSAWHDTLRYTSVFDTNHGYIANRESFDGATWQNFERLTQVVDSHSHETGNREENWNGTTYDIIYENQTLLSYNGSGSVVSKIYRDWDISGDSLMNIYKKEFDDFLPFEFNFASGMKDSEAKVLFYPNPVKSEAELNFRLDLQQKNLYELRILDITGKEYGRYFFHETEFKINTQNLPSGVYFFQFIFENYKTTSGKFIVL